MFSHKSDFALACLYFAAALLAILSCALTASSALKSIALICMTIFIAASFMEVSTSPRFSRGRWRKVSRITSLLIPVPFYLLALSHAPVTVLRGPDCTLLRSFCHAEEVACLEKAESLERQGKYQEAENYYRQWIDLRKKSDPHECLDGVLARILDLQGCHGEAEQYYSSFEKHTADRLARQATTDCFLPKAPSRHRGGIVVVADGRLLRILQTIPRERALAEFDFAGAILNCANLTASQLGQKRSILDLRPEVEDFRGAEGAPVVTPGKVLRGWQLRRHLSKIGRDKAIVEFEFADYYFPRPNARFVRENYPASPLSGYKYIARVRDLIPEQIAIIDEKDYAKLKKLSGL
jgi:tetratricopeptide (TPR) repeat protein